jgi:methionyl-tRNA formyltransferase
MSLRVIFMGTSDFSVPALSEIVGAGHEVCAVYTRAPRPAGRGMKETRSAVHVFADGLGLQVKTPATLRSDEEADCFRAFDADAVVVVAYGLLLPLPILEAPVLGCFNIHASLLPRWRGAAPIHRAVMAGDEYTGVAIMQMEEGLDTGPVAMLEKIPIGLFDSTGDVHDRLARLGADLMLRALGGLERGGLSLKAQNADGITYAAKITNAESRIDWQLPASRVHDHIRGLSPSPGAWCMADLGKGPERVKIMRSEPASGKGAAGTVLNLDGTIACGHNAVRLLQVQRAGKGPMPFADFANGARLGTGFRFSSCPATS